MSEISEKWGVYFDRKEEEFCICKRYASPIGTVEIDTFWAEDRKDALAKGHVITEAYLAGAYPDIVIPDQGETEGGENGSFPVSTE